MATADFIYISTNSGLTWSQNGTSQQWGQGIASSADGTKLATSVDPGYIYTSTDSGATWSQRGTSQNWIGLASSADGTKLVATTFGGFIYTSSGPVP